MTALDLLEIYGGIVSTIGLIVAIIALIRSSYAPDKLELSLKDPPFEDTLVSNVQPQTTRRSFCIIVKNKHKKQWPRVASLTLSA